MKDDEIDDEINDKDFVLKLLIFSTLSLSFMSEDV